MSNKYGFKQKLKEYRKKPFSLMLFIITMLAAIITVSILMFLIIYILVKGIPYLRPSLFEWKYNSNNVSLMPALINTVLMTFFALIFAAPVGIFAAIYLTEYAKRGSKIVSVIRITAETLSGIPSIVYGLFGMLFFVNALKLGISLLSGALTLAIMILPLIMRTTQEALASVADIYREGSFGLGAGRLRTIFKIVLPSAVPGIMAGIILAVGRIVGETAALIYTSGTVAEAASGGDFLFDSTRTLSLHMYALSNEGLHVNEAYATAVILLVLVIVINRVSAFFAAKMTAK